MYVGTDFDPAEPGEQDVYTFDFSKRLAAGETLTAATWALSSPGDDSATSRLIGAPAYTAGGLTTQTISTAVACTYLPDATVTTSAGRKLMYWSHIPTIAAT